MKEDLIIMGFFFYYAACFWLGMNMNRVAVYLFTEGYRHEMVGGYGYDGYYHVPRYLRYWPVTLPAKIKCYYQSVKEATGD